MNDRQDEMVYEHEEPAPKGRGCLFWGCLTFAILFLIVVIGVPLAGYFWVKGQVQKYTSDKPLEIAAVEMSEEELEALNTRFDAFNDALEAGDTPPDLELTADEVNALIGQNEEMAGMVHVRIQDGQIGGDVSIPADAAPGGGGRYFNASADFDVSMEGGVLIVTVADATVNDAPLPAQFLTALQNENLAKDAYDDPDTAKVLRKFESLEIVGDKILLKAKPPADDAPAEVESSEEFETVVEEQVESETETAVEVVE